MDTVNVVNAETSTDKFNVALKVNSIEKMKKPEYDATVDASFDFNGKTFNAKVNVTLSSSYNMQKAKTEDDMYAAFMRDFRICEMDKIMNNLSSIIEFNLGDYKTNGIYDFYKKLIYAEKEEKRQELSKYYTANWNNSMLVKRRAMIEKCGGILNQDNCEDFVKYCLKNQCNSIFAIFQAPHPTVDGGILVVYIEQKDSVKVKNERYFVRAAFASESHKNMKHMKLETAIDVALNMIQDKIAQLKRENTDKITYETRTSILREQLKSNRIYCEIEEYHTYHDVYTTAIYSEIVGVSLRIFSDVNFDKFRIEGINGKRENKYSIDSIYFTIEEMINVFNVLCTSINKKEHDYNDKLNKDIRMD